MPEKTHLVRSLFIIVMSTVIGGTVGYVLIEDGWSLFDAFYMTVITLTTIGFTEVHGLSDAGRLFTIALIVCGLGAAATFVSQFAQLMVDGSVRDLWRTRRLEKIMGRLKDHVIICGYGRIGQAIATNLRERGVSCVVVERGQDRAAEARRAGLTVVEGNATCDRVLSSVGIDRATVLVAALSQDAENVFVALAARDLNPHVVVIARAEDRSIETRMLRAGVNRVVCPAWLGGGLMARMVGEELGREDLATGRRATDVLGYDLGLYRNHQRRDLDVAEVVEMTGAVRALAVVSHDGHRSENPAPDAVVADGDAVVLLMAMNEDDEDEFADEVSEPAAAR